MKKVHSAGFRPVTFVHFCHHTPQGDVGEPAKDFCTKRTVWDHTPQGDVGEPTFCYELYTELNITPRKGT